MKLKTGNVISIEKINEHLPCTDLLIASTAAAEPVLTYSSVENTLTKRDTPLLIIDIAVPRDIEPEIDEFDCVTLVNIDNLNKQIDANQHRRAKEIPKAERIVSEFTDQFAKWYDSLNLIPVISQLTKRASDFAADEAKRYAGDFTQADHQKLQLFAQSLVNKMLHGPISFLKSDDDELNEEKLYAVDLINKMFLSQNGCD